MRSRFFQTNQNASTPEIQVACSRDASRDRQAHPGPSCGRNPEPEPTALSIRLARHRHPSRPSRGASDQARGSADDEVAGPGGYEFNVVAAPVEVNAVPNDVPLSRRDAVQDARRPAPGVGDDTLSPANVPGWACKGVQAASTRMALGSHTRPMVAWTSKGSTIAFTGMEAAASSWA